jgi:UDP-N-acetylglucosamine 2-epimerase (non-hydrolysing)
MKIISVVGARPNFMKIAPFCKAIETYNATNKANQIKHVLVHTGQHYDVRMSESFFESLGIPNPDINLEVGSGSHAEQVGNTMIAFEQVCIDLQPDWVVVVGDVNATLACSVTAKKLNIKVCHIEAGLRSNDMTMPEEVNRLVTDRLSDLLLTPDRISVENLKAEGVDDSRMSFVGNIMIDTLETNRDKAAKLEPIAIIKDNLIDPTELSQAEKALKNTDTFAVSTLHRPSNVDDKEVLEPILDFLATEVTQDMPVIWAIHPRTQKMLQSFGIWEKALASSKLILLNPIGYHEMLRLNMSAAIMLTDSGGLQEECCVLGTPCLTLRWNTERPVTLKEYGGASVLVGNNIDRIREEYHVALQAGRAPQRPELWDGNTAMRCVEAIVGY